MPDLTVTSAIAAAAPLIVVILVMAVFRWPAMAAGAAGLFVAALIALTLFENTNTAIYTPFFLIQGIAAETMHSAATILWIILAALVLFEYQKRSGGIDRIRNALASITDNKRIEALLIAWFFGLFIEGAAGFGTPVALAAPLLVGVGFSPIRAVTMALVGHAAGVPFGAVGTPTLAQLDISGLAASPVAGTVAAINILLGLGLLLVLMRLAHKEPLTKSDLGWATLAGGCFFIPYLVLALFTGPELPALAGAMIGLGIFLTVLRVRTDMGQIDLRGLLHDIAPYLLLVVMILATRLISPLREAFTGLALSWNLHDAFQGSFAPLYHPGTLMLVAIVISAIVAKRFALVGPSFASALHRLFSVAIALILMLALSRTMVHTGMIDTLAQTAALTGVAWPVLAPFIGTLGTFVSGSATTSNILFTQFQMSTAAALELSPIAMAAAQGVGAAIGNIIAPHNIIAGCATVGASHREGEIMSKTLPLATLCLVGTGALILLLS